MSHPPVVIVNEQDNAVGEAMLADARARGLIYRVVFVVAQNSAGQFLLQKRAAGMQLFPNCWDTTASGHVDGGRSYEEAARLELEEEVGIHGVPLSEIAHFYTEEPLLNGLRTRRYAKIFRFSWQETPQNIGRDEVSEVRWFTKHEIAELLRTHPEQAAEGLQHLYNKVLA